MNSTSASHSPESQTFTQALQTLQLTLERFRQDTLPPEEALRLFENGLQQAQTCQSLLSQAQSRLQQLKTSLPAQNNASNTPNQRPQWQCTLSSPWNETQLQTFVKHLQKHFALKPNTKIPQQWQDPHGQAVLLLDEGLLLLLVNQTQLTLEFVPNANTVLPPFEAQALQDWLQNEATRL